MAQTPRTASRKTTRPRSAKPAARTRAAAPPPPELNGNGRDPRVLADSLGQLLASVDAEVAAVSELSRRIDQTADALMALFAEQRERSIVLQQLRDSISGGNLASFLQETIQPAHPQRLAALSQDIDATQAVLSS